MAAESATAAVYLGIPSHQPRSEHDGQHFQLDLKERQGQVCAGEESVRHQGLPRLPRGRPHERLCLELS